MTQTTDVDEQYRRMGGLRSESLEDRAVRATIIIPAYNEEAALPQVLRDIFAVIDDTYEVLVVNDGSRDKTREVALTFPCRVISHAQNRGKGAAMQTGIKHALTERVVFIDGDATYPANAIPTVVRLLDRYDLVRCVRSEGRDHIPFLNRLGNQFFNTIISLIHRVDGGDILSGLYGMQRRHLLAMQLDSTGFDIETEIMVKAHVMGLQLHTVPIQYFARIGKKKLNPVIDGMRILTRVLRLALLLNPFLAYILPGLALWVIGLMIVFGMIGAAPANLEPMAMLYLPATGMMSFLAGLTLIILGSVVHLYTGAVGLSKASGMLQWFVSRTLRRTITMVCLGLVLTGVVGSLGLLLLWSAGGFPPFPYTTQLLVCSWLVISGLQLLSMMIFFSLFVRSFYQVDTKQREPVHLEIAHGEAKARTV